MRTEHTAVRRGAVMVMAFTSLCASLAIEADYMDKEASTGSVTIMTPRDGAMLPATGENELAYSIKLGQGDDHFHVWVDGEKGPAQRDLEGRYVLPKMAPGKHAIIVKVVDKGHVPTGPQQSVFVTVE